MLKDGLKDIAEFDDWAAAGENAEKLFKPAGKTGARRALSSHLPQSMLGWVGRWVGGVDGWVDGRVGKWVRRVG